jgi:hypothetical protein
VRREFKITNFKYDYGYDVISVLMIAIYLGFNYILV